jgi:DNA ligase-1
MTDFPLLQKVVGELNATNSTNDKKLILEKYKSNEFIKKVLYYTYNPFYQYYVTPENLEKNYEDDLGTLYEFMDLFEMLDALRAREVTGHRAINSVNDFCWKNEEFKDLIYKIIGKDLEIRMGDSLINKVIPGLIPTFDVALAANMEDVKIDFVKDTWVSSRKLDGVRCLAVIDDKGSVSLWSRQGNEFETLQKVKDEIVKLGLKDKVLDGEICLVDANGNEDFQGIMKQIRRKEHTISNPKYLVFDVIDGSAFRSKLGNKLYSSRYSELNSYLYNAKEKGFNQILKALIGRNLFDKDAYYPILNENDTAILKAVEV